MIIAECDVDNGAIVQGWLNICIGEGLTIALANQDDGIGASRIRREGFMSSTDLRNVSSEPGLGLP